MFVAVSRCLALSAVAFALGSCAQLQDLLAQLPKPTANVVGVNFQDLSTEALTLGFDVDVKNPYSAALPLGKLDFSLASADQPFVTGLVDAAQSIPAKSNGLVKLPVTIKFKELLGALQHVKPGQVVPYVAKFNLGVDAPGVGPMNLPLEKAGEVPVPTVPQVELAGMKIGQLSLKKASCELAFKVTNTNEFPFDLKNLGYDLKLSGAQIAKASVLSTQAFEPNQAQEIRIPLEFAPSDLGLAVFNILKGDASDYKIAGLLDLDTPFGKLQTPYQREGKAAFWR